MGAKFWSESEKAYFREQILPLSKYASGEYNPDVGLDFSELAEKMQRDCDAQGISKRQYTEGGLFQHYYQKFSRRAYTRGEADPRMASQATPSAPSIMVSAPATTNRGRSGIMGRGYTLSNYQLDGGVNRTIKPNPAIFHSMRSAARRGRPHRADDYINRWTQTIHSGNIGTKSKDLRDYLFSDDDEGEDDCKGDDMVLAGEVPMEQNQESKLKRARTFSPDSYHEENDLVPEERPIQAKPPPKKRAIGHSKHISYEDEEFEASQAAEDFANGDSLQNASNASNFSPIITGVELHSSGHGGEHQPALLREDQETSHDNRSHDRRSKGQGQGLFVTPDLEQEDVSRFEDFGAPGPKPVDRSDFLTRGMTSGMVGQEPVQHGPIRGGKNRGGTVRGGTGRGRPIQGGPIRGETTRGSMQDPAVLRSPFPPPNHPSSLVPRYSNSSSQPMSGGRGSAAPARRLHAENVYQSSYYQHPGMDRDYSQQDDMTTTYVDNAYQNSDDRVMTHGQHLQAVRDRQEQSTPQDLVQLYNMRPTNNNRYRRPVAGGRHSQFTPRFLARAPGSPVNINSSMSRRDSLELLAGNLPGNASRQGAVRSTFEAAPTSLADNPTQSRSFGSPRFPPAGGAELYDRNFPNNLSSERLSQLLQNAPISQPKLTISRRSLNTRIPVEDPSLTYTRRATSNPASRRRQPALARPQVSTIEQPIVDDKSVIDLTASPTMTGSTIPSEAIRVDAEKTPPNRPATTAELDKPSPANNTPRSTLMRDIVIGAGLIPSFKPWRPPVEHSETNDAIEPPNSQSREMESQGRLSVNQGDEEHAIKVVATKEAAMKEVVEEIPAKDINAKEAVPEELAKGLQSSTLDN